MLPNNPYCDLVDTGNKFNGKNVYQCSYCGIKLGLENPKTQMLCFKKMQDYSEAIYKTQDPLYKNPIELKPGENLKDVVLQEAYNTPSLNGRNNSNESNDDPKNLCSEDQINQRLAICNSCEHYKDNSCVLCGCRIVRESNYMNKLAHKNQKCPINKWGPLT